jgi:hypothetical protein
MLNTNQNTNQIPKDVENLISKHFADLKVIDFAGFLPSGKKRQSAWVCLCKCGKTVTVRRNNLMSGTTKSCGCRKLKENKFFDKVSLIGKKFGKLKVIEFSHRETKQTKKRSVTKTFWKCICDCGKECVKCRGNLLNGNTKSCGCLELARNELLKNKGIQKNILNCGEAALNLYYGDYKHRAKVKNLLFTLTKEEFKKLIFSNCFFCDELPVRQFPPEGRLKNRKNNGIIYVNGIDRKNSKDGYVIENCLPCCKICNKAKLDMSIQEFENWLFKIAKKYKNT